MTVIIHIGRRIPKKWFKRLANKAKGFMSFQENIWIMIKQSLQTAKKKSGQVENLNVVMTTKFESEDLNYQIEWMEVHVQGTPEQEKEEYDKAQNLYKKLGAQFKKDIPINDDMKKHFKTSVLSSMKIDEAYREGYGAMEDNNIANKLLEMGILTHIEWVKDFDSRDTIIPT